jgi:hypothetical protein
VFRDHASAEIEALVSFELGGRAAPAEAGAHREEGAIAHSHAAPGALSDEESYSGEGSLSDEGSLYGDESLSDEELEMLADSLLLDLPVEDPGSTSDLDWEQWLRPRLWLGFGIRAEALQNEDSRSGDYDELAAVATIARDAIAGVWFDVRAEAGRRDYRGSGPRGGLIFEGLDLSLTGTDYRFISTTVLLEAPLPFSLLVSGFGQYDHEWHDVTADDFELWLVTLSLTRTF